MSTSGATQPGHYGFTVYSYPATGTFAADRAAVIGNDSGAAAQVGSDFAGVLTPAEARSYTTNPVLLDGIDYSRTLYRSQVITVPVVIYEQTAQAALLEWRRIVAAFGARHRRAALRATDPAASGQESRWLIELLFRDATPVPVQYDGQHWFTARIQFETIGSPFWTPEPIAANEITQNVTITAPGTIHQIFLTNPGDQGAWPEIDVAGLNVNATVTVVNSATLETVTIIDVGSGNTGIHFDRRQRPATDDARVAPQSIYFEIPPSATTRLDVFVTEAVAGNSSVSAAFLPRYSTL